jgi:hypothetical protein
MVQNSGNFSTYMLDCLWPNICPYFVDGLVTRQSRALMMTCCHATAFVNPPSSIAFAMLPQEIVDIIVRMVDPEDVDSFKAFAPVSPSLRAAA